MALIDLAQLRKLHTEARLRKHLVDTYAFEPKARMNVDLDDATIVSFFRMHSQAKNLLDQLTKLHSVCSDFAEGNLQKYVDEHQQDASDDEPFDPYFELEYLFDGQTVYDLPPTIQQYKELYAMSLNYAKIREVAEQALDLAFDGKLQWHLPVQEDGQTVYKPEKELPKDLVDTFHYEQQIANIQTEYALDLYNLFYSKCRQIIQSNRATGNIQDCALEILSLFRTH